MDDSFRFDDHQSIHNARRDPIETGKKEALKASLFGAFPRSTVSWWRSARISASSEARDRTSPMTAHHISLSTSPMGRRLAIAGRARWRTARKDKRRHSQRPRKRHTLLLTT